MIKNSNHPLVLKIPAQEAFIPMAPSFVRQAAKGFGLAGEAADWLSLGAEEVIAYLARIGAPGQDVEIRCVAGSHFVQADFTLPVQSLQLQAFNRTATVCIEDETGLEEMGLLIASRMVDRFRISRKGSGNLELSLVQENIYPAIEDPSPEQTKPLSRFTLREPDPAQIKWFVRLVNRCYPSTVFPADFRYPGKVVDMAAGGDYRIVLAEGPTGEIGGGLAFKWEGPKTVEFFGPYVFHPESDPEMARTLLEACINAVARTQALVLINRMPCSRLPEGYLEPLGTLRMLGPDGAPEEVTAYFRQMIEDTGSVVWTHPDLSGFLQSEYRRLVFPREIHPVFSEGEAGEPFSVLSVDIDRPLGRATLRPIWPGADREENLAGHLRLLKMEELALVFFEMDLGLSWQAELTPALLKLGFTPRMILPYAGAGDLVIFQLDSDRS